MGFFQFFKIANKEVHEPNCSLNVDNLNFNENLTFTLLLSLVNFFSYLDGFN
jgi:hypothetical protein